MSKVLLLFIDGLGIGTRGVHNPLDQMGAHVAPLNVFQEQQPELSHGGIMVRTDASLGVEGRPQSASGQTTILTGINAPLLLGYHKQGFPNSVLREIIQKHSIFRQLKLAGIDPNVFANAYSERFFETRPRWVSATTVAVEAAQMSFCNMTDLRAGQALYHDFTNNLLIEPGVQDVTRRTPDEAAKILADIVDRHRFTLYEYFITDKVGHQQDFEKARAVLIDLARFVRALLDCLNLKETTFLVTSDHGNIENLHTRNHTLNLVPTLAWGRDSSIVARRVKSLTDITPVVIEILTAEN